MRSDDMKISSPDHCSFSIQPSVPAEGEREEGGVEEGKEGEEE